MTVNEIRNYLGPRVFNRALSYQRNKAVSIVSMNQAGTCVAKVFGTLSDPYIVTVDLKKGRYECTCPAEKPCKHIGAVLLELARIEKESQSLSERIREIEQQVSHNKDIHITLQGGQAASFEITSLFSEEQSTSLTRSATAAERFRLIFTVETQPYHTYLRLYPSLVYLKKDGSDGRIQSFQKKKLTEMPPPSLALLLEILNYGKFNTVSEISLGSYFPKLLKDKALKDNFYTHSGKSITFVSFDKIKLSFEAIQQNDGFETKTGDIRFDYAITLFSKKRELAKCLPVKTIFAHESVVFLVDDATIYYNHLNFNLYTFFRKIHSTGRESRLTSADIHLIKTWVKNHLNEWVIVDFDMQSVRIRNQLPVRILECVEIDETVGLSFYFRYAGKEYPLELNDIPRLYNQNDSQNKQIIMVRRCAEYEKLFVMSVFERVRARVVEGKREHRNFNYDNTPDFLIHARLIDFMKDHVKSLIEDGVEIRIAKHLLSVSKSAAVRIKPRSGINWFSAVAMYEEEGTMEKIEIDPVLLKAGIIKVKGRYVLLSQKDINRLLTLKKYGMNDTGHITLHNRDLAAIHELYKLDITDERNLFGTISDIFEKLSGFRKIDEAELPLNFTGTLRPYQKEGYKWLHFLYKYDLNGILADDMGLGKTVQTLAFMQSLKEKGELSTSLLVVPVSTIPNWAREIERFCPGLRYSKQTGGGRIKELKKLRAFDILITSYQTLSRDLKLLKEIEFCYLILDESQNIKNSKTLAFKTVRLLKSRHRLSLTGTPIENNSAELWSQMDFLNPGLLGSMNKFKALYGRPIECENNDEKAEVLRGKIYPFMLRRKKHEVAKDLPPKEEIVLYAPMNTQQAEIYERLRGESERIIEKMKRESPQKNFRGPVIDMGTEGKSLAELCTDEDLIAPNHFFVFVLMLKLRQIALFPRLVDRQYLGIESCKFELLKEKVEEILAEGNKVLIFSQFVRVLSIIRTYLDQKGYAYAYLDGSTRNRESVIDTFQNDDSIKIFLISLKAGGVGINLTAADYVILFDPWWNPAVENQAIDRAHRIGRRNKVIVYRLIAKDTIEERILELQEHKRDLFDRLITTDSGFFKSLTDEDLMGLFR